MVVQPWASTVEGAGERERPGSGGTGNRVVGGVAAGDGGRASGVRRPASGVRRPASGVRRPAFGARVAVENTPTPGGQRGMVCVPRGSRVPPPHRSRSIPVRTIARHPLTLLLSAALALSSAGVQAAEPLEYVSGYGPEIIGYTLDGSGKLTEVSRPPGGSNPSFLAWSPDRKNLYAVNEGNGGGKVLSFAIDHASGKLTKTGEGSMGEAGSACHVSVHPSGKWVFTASYGSGHVTVMPIKADGSIGDAVDVQMAGKNAHQTVSNKDGTLLFVPTLGIDQVQVYRVDAVKGKLTQVTSIALAKGVGPRH